MATVIIPEPDSYATVEKDLELTVGETFTDKFDILDADGDPIDVSSYNMVGEVRSRDGRLLLTIALFALLTQTSGRGYAVAPQASTIGLGDLAHEFPAFYEYKLQFTGTLLSQSAISIQRGSMTLKPQIVKSGVTS